MRKQTIEDFIAKFRKKFPHKDYLFDNSVYTHSHKKIEVKCDKGHQFNIRPCDLLNGYGCPICGGTKKLTKEDFIEKASFVHKNYFTYEHCGFENVSNYVTVTCPIHGDFKVKANNHLHGANCKKCQLSGIKHETQPLPTVNKSTKKLNNYEFKKRVIEVWGERYIVNDKTMYEKSNKPVIITCPEHGEFSITPNHLLSGRGCPKCGKNKKKTKTEIIEEIKKAQPYSDYDFSNVNYHGIHCPILLKCNKCGTTFSNSPANLIKYKNGCPGCGISQIEVEIKNFLIENGVKFEQQKTFDWLLFKRKLKLDFYLTEYNAIIECQGIQHFKETKFDGKTSQLKEVQERDKIKRNLCLKNGLKIYYYSNFHIDFPYHVYVDKDILLNDIKRNITNF